jgi:hypothetical protein
MLSSRARTPGALLLIAVLALAGCSSNDSPVSPNPVTSQTDADDMAFQAMIAFDDVNTVVDGAGVSSAQATPLSARSGRFAPQSAPGAFAVLSDTTFERGNVTFELSRRFFSVTHVEQTVPDGTTDSVVVTSRAFGTDSTSTARYRVTVGHAGQLRVGGLFALRPEATLEGAWADTLDSRFTALQAAVTRTFYARVLTVANGVTIVKSGGTGYPATGTIVWTIHAQRTHDGNRADVEKTLDAVVTLTFNGTRYPTVTVNGVWSYKLDLDTGIIIRYGSL